MATLLLCMALQEPRVTLDVVDEPLGVAAILALAPFGDEARWPAAPWALRRVSFRLKDAGYMETLDTLGELAGWGRVLDPYHLILNGSPNECITFGTTESLAAVDPTPSLRLLIGLWEDAREESFFGMTLIAPPGPSTRRFRFEGAVSGQGLQGDFQPFQENDAGDPARYSLWPKLSRQKVGDLFTLEGALVLGDGSRIPVRTGPLPLPPRPAPPVPPPSRIPLPLWALVFGGLSLTVALIYLGLRYRRVTN